MARRKTIKNLSKSDGTLAAVKLLIDRAIKIGATISIFTHVLTLTPDAYSTTPAIYTGMLDYIKERKMQVLTWSEWYKRLNSNRKKS